MFRLVSKIGYLIAHPQVLWKERCAEARARVWAREMAKKA